MLIDKGFAIKWIEKSPLLNKENSEICKRECDTKEVFISRRNRRAIIYYLFEKKFR